MLFGIAGPTASGKTTVTQFLMEEYNAPQMRYSEVLSEIAAERGLDPTDKATLQDLYTSEKETRGERWLATEIADRAQALASEHLIIEGNRLKVDLDTLTLVAQVRHEDWILIFIDASTATRFKRYNERLKRQGKEPITRDAFTILENKPTEAEIKDLRQYAQEHGIYIDTDTHDVESTLRAVHAALTEKGH